MEKKNNGLMVVTIILGVLLIASIGYIIYSNQDNLKDNKTNNTQNTTITEEEKEKTVKEIINKFKFNDYTADSKKFSVSVLYHFQVGDKETKYANDYTAFVWCYADNIDSAKFTYKKCPTSVLNEMVDKEILSDDGDGNYTGQAGKCEDFNFVKEEFFTKIKNEYFGTDATLDEVYMYHHLPKNKLYVDAGGDTYGYYEAKLYDSKMPSKDTVELYYNTITLKDDSEGNQPNNQISRKVKYTFKKEDSNWIFYSAQGL